MPTPHALDRFVEAQDEGHTYARALSELRAGHKASHWMWFIFPQIAGLGHSPMARRYALSSLGEAEAYLEHPVLGARLLECTRALLEHPDRTAPSILGDVDAMKLRSSMTLFARAAPSEPAFEDALNRCFAGEPDDATLQRI